MLKLKTAYEWVVHVVRTYISAALLCVVGGGAGVIAGELLTQRLGASAPLLLGGLGVAIGALASSTPQWMSLDRKVRRLDLLRQAQAAEADAILAAVNKLPATAPAELREAMLARYGDVYVSAATTQQFYGVGQ